MSAGATHRECDSRCEDWSDSLDSLDSVGDPRALVSALLADDVGLHPCCVKRAMRRVMCALVCADDYELRMRSQRSSDARVGGGSESSQTHSLSQDVVDSDNDGSACHGARSWFASELVEECVSHFERARHRDLDSVTWLAGSRARVRPTDAEALTRPNLEWATWALERLLAVAERRLAPALMETEVVSHRSTCAAELFAAGTFGE